MSITLPATGGIVMSEVATGWTTMTDSMKHWMNSILPAPSDRPQIGSCWQPAVDVYETATGWLVKFDIAGVRPEDVSVRISGSRLIVGGCRRDQTTETGLRYYRMEISYSCFERTIELPHTIDATGISREFRDGMLLLRIQKGETR